MLIASRFKRPTAPITLGDRDYFFLPSDPRNADSEHVCEITDKAHIQTLLAIPEGYYLADDAPAPSRPATRPTATVTADSAVATVPPVDPATPPDAVQVLELDEDQRQAATNLNTLSWQGLKAQISKGGIPLVVLHEALRIEQAKDEEDQRATTIKILTQAIEAG